MTVNTTSITAGPFEGNDVTDTFPYTFKILADSELIVYETDDASGAVSTKVLTTDYTVSGVGENGGNVVRVGGALPTGKTWYVRSAKLAKQLTSFASQGNFSPIIHEDAFDLITYLLQQHEDLINRTFRIADSDAAGVDANLTLPNVASRANKFLSFDNNGDLTITTAVGIWRGDWATSTGYIAQDMFKDPATENVYFVVNAHTSSSVAADEAAGDIEILIDVAAATNQKLYAQEWANKAEDSLVSAAAGGDEADDYSALHWNAKANLQRQYAKEWADKAEDSLVSTAAGGDGSTDYSSLHHAAKAAASASAASTSEGNASASESSASSSASAAASFAAAASSDAAAAATAYDNFDDRYLGEKTSDPALDNDGNALLTGALYFNTVSDKMKVYNGAAWQLTTADASDVGFTAYGDLASTDVQAAIQELDDEKVANSRITISTSAASGGSDGDLWFRYTA